MGLGLLIGDTEHLSPEDMAQCPIPFALASHVRVVRFFLCLVARLRLGLVGPEPHLDGNVARCPEKAVHYGWHGGFYCHDPIGDHLDQGVDAQAWQALANLAPRGVCHRVARNYSLLVA